MNNTDKEKNINVTLKQNDDEKGKFTISFNMMLQQLKRVFLLWLVISMITGLISTSITLLLKNFVQFEPITTLVQFNYSGINSGLAPDGSVLNVNKIKSPNIIEKALTKLDIPIDSVEKIRQNISIEGIVPNSTYDKISMYKTIYESGGAAALDAVEVLLDTGFFSTYYKISFDNTSAEFDYEDGKEIINTMLDEYQDYFFKTYGYNSALGKGIVAIDYTEYDYPAAVDVFKTILDDLDNYTNSLKGNSSGNFRSNKTGYSLDDITRNIEIIRSADLNPISAYISIHKVTKDIEQLITYYQYKIENFEREVAVLKEQINSLSDSINAYEKDSMLIFGDNGNMSENEYSQVSEKYDQLIEQRVAVQETYSNKKQLVEYYKRRVELFKNHTEKNDADIGYVEDSLKRVNEKINNLIDITTETSDEYYENIVFANAFNILVPATGEQKQDTKMLIFPIIIAEAVVFFIFIVYIIIKSITLNKTVENQSENQSDENEQNIQ